MKKIAFIIGVVMVVLFAANAGFAAPHGVYGGHGSSYSGGHYGGYYGGHGYWRGYNGYYRGYGYWGGGRYVVGAPGIYIPFLPRVVIGAYPY
jgi:hypothetical protein